jgi:Ser/Thr protein kinase RdoA (MazF antagonist)
VSPQLPRGALLVEEIDGRPASLPADLVAIAGALAAIHALSVPAAGARGPLASPHDPLLALAEEIGAQAAYVPKAQLEAQVRQALQEELQALASLKHKGGRPGVQLVSFDAHPGNFLMRAEGNAVLVDLEKCRYSYPGLDLAHATLYTSTTWDVASRAVLSLPEVCAFYRAWERAVGPAVADAARPWHVALRRAMWLWSITWCCKWRVLSGHAAAPEAGGEDWSADKSDAQLIAHVRGRVDHYLSSPAVRLVRQELDALPQALAG